MRKQMTKVELFHVMQWINEQTKEYFASLTISDIAKQARKDLIASVPNITDHCVRSIIKEMGIVVLTTKVSDFDYSITSSELLNRIKRLEKFCTKYFTEEWRELE